VWLALEFKRVPYNLKVLSFQANDTKKPEFVALNSRHTVPTIVDDGYSLWESLAILEYLEDRFTSGPKLYPGDAKNRGRIRRLIREMEEYLGREGIDAITTELFFKGDEAADMDKVAKGRERLKEELEYFAKELRTQFLAGDAPTAADFVFYPYLGYVWRINFRKPETKLEEIVPAPIADYRKRIEALPYFDQTFPPHWR
jgi:glutathione S-transferase